MAFQIVDDLLDFTGEEDALGKPVGGDLREGKMTLPVIHLLAQRRCARRQLIRKIVNERSATIDEWRELRDLLAQHRSIDYARRAASDFVERAKKALYMFPASCRARRADVSCPITSSRRDLVNAAERIAELRRLDSLPRRALLRPQRSGDRRRRIRRAHAGARASRSATIPISSPPTRRRSASADVPPPASRPSNMPSRCSASTTRTPRRNCASSTSACAAGLAAAGAPARQRRLCRRAEDRRPQPGADL